MPTGITIRALLRFYGVCLATALFLVPLHTSAQGVQVQIVASTQQLCPGQRATLGVTAGFTVNRWSTGATTETIKVTTVGTYQVWATYLATGEESTNTIVISPKPGPRPVIGNPQEYICSGDVLRLEAPATFSSYRWSTGDTGNEIEVSSAGVYWLEVTDADGCVGRSDEVEVIIVQRPDPMIQGPVLVCKSVSADYAVFNIPNATYEWRIDGGTITSTTTQSVASVEWQRSGRLECIVSVPRPDGGFCSATARFFVTMRNGDVPVIVPSATTVCEGQPIKIVASPGFEEYRWNIGATTTSIVPSSTGYYWVETVDADGCVERSDSVLIRIHPNPRVNIDGPMVVCNGQTIELLGSCSNTDIVEWQWSTGDRTTTTTISTPGSYTLIATSINGCVETATFVVSGPGTLNVTASDVDFGTSELGVSVNRPITITNRSNEVVLVSGVNNLDNTVRIVTPFPLRIEPRSSVVLLSTWVPTATGVLSNRAQFVYTGESCTDSTGVLFTGEAVNTDTVGLFSVSTTDTILSVGSPLRMPIAFHINMPYGSSATIEFDVIVGTPFHVETVEGAFEVMRSHDANNQRFTLRLQADSDTTGTLFLDGITMLQQPFRASIIFENLSVTSTSTILTEQTPGSVSLNGCWLPGRLIEFSDVALTQRIYTLDGRQITTGDMCRPCVVVLLHPSGFPVATYLTNNISR